MKRSGILEGSSICGREGPGGPTQASVDVRPSRNGLSFHFRATLRIGRVAWTGLHWVCLGVLRVVCHHSDPAPLTRIALVPLACRSFARGRLGLCRPNSARVWPKSTELARHWPIWFGRCPKVAISPVLADLSIAIRDSTFWASSWAEDVVWRRSRRRYSRRLMTASRFQSALDRLLSVVCRPLVPHLGWGAAGRHVDCKCGASASRPRGCGLAFSWLSPGRSARVSLAPGALWPVPFPSAPPLIASVPILFARGLVVPTSWRHRCGPVNLQSISREPRFAQDVLELVLHLVGHRRRRRCGPEIRGKDALLEQGHKELEQVFLPYFARDVRERIPLDMSHQSVLVVEPRVMAHSVVELGFAPIVDPSRHEPDDSRRLGNFAPPFGCHSEVPGGLEGVDLVFV